MTAQKHTSRHYGKACEFVEVPGQGWDVLIDGIWMRRWENLPMAKKWAKAHARALSPWWRLF